jgi:hypothetical protein
MSSPDSARFITNIDGKLLAFPITEEGNIIPIPISLEDAIADDLTSFSSSIPVNSQSDSGSKPKPPPNLGNELGVLK